MTLGRLLWVGMMTIFPIAELGGWIPGSSSYAEASEDRSRE